MKSVLAGLLTAVAFTVSGQGFYNKGSIVTITPQTIFTVPDSLVNSGTLTNNGNVKVAGAWINLGTYDAGNGEINFSNSLTQVINHHDQSIGKLTVSGGGVKQFLANITVQSEIKFESGILVSGNGAKIIFNEGVKIDGAGSLSYIKGPVENKGKGDWIFPVGNDTHFLPVKITGVTDAAAVGTITLTEPAGDLKGDPDIEKLSAKRYWQLVMSGGKIDEARITLPISEEETLGGDINSLVVAGAGSQAGPFSNLGQLQSTGTLSSGTVTSSKSSSSFQFFTVAKSSGESDILVYNAVSANLDGKNEFMRIDNIEQYPSNSVTIFNRWGDKVFEISGYNNDQRNFRGESNVNSSKLTAGTYFYSIDLGNGSEKKTGYLVLK